MEPDTSSSEVTKRIGDSTAHKLFGVESASAATEAAGDFIGCYKLIEPLGEGGGGTVWRAEQHEPIHREVALKVIKLGMDSREIIARFEAERQVLALMDHPNIAGVLDAGTTQNGRPYFVMELVKGHAITDYADEHKLTIRQRLELFIPVCQAVQHAHQKAILHRDLKPSNILVTELDGKPVPKVIDFGIAKALGTSPEAMLKASLLHTQAGAVIGTPRYMSPEQAGTSADSGVLIELQDHAGAARNASELTVLRPQDPLGYHRAAQLIALCVPLAKADQALDPQTRQKTADTYAGQAVDFLRQAIGNGFKEAAKIKTEEEFAPLCARSDFQALFTKEPASTAHPKPAPVSAPKP